jgi:membrane-associated phospholipid phosphatase
MPASRAVRPVREAPRPAVEPATPVRVRPGLDAMIIVGAAAPGIALGLWVEPALQNNVPTPGSDPHVRKIDRVALDRFASAPNVASDVLLGTSVLAPFVYHAIEAGVRRRGWSPIRGRGFVVRYGTDVMILLETLAVNALLTQLLKTAIRRPRPYTFIDPETVDPSIRDELIAAQAENDADWSFPSGHASFAFAATTAGATLLTLEMLGRSRWAIALAWIGGISLASTTAALRVAAGRHFPSDVITSALFGSGVGAAVPLAHWRPTPSGEYGRLDRRPRRWTLSPMMGRVASGAVLTTRW